MRSVATIIVLTLAALLGACERRDLCYASDPTSRNIVVAIDWVNLSVTPTGVTILCYPEGGGTPTTLQTNSVDEGAITLEYGEYNVLVFNQITSDFGTLEFVGMDSYTTAEVYAVSTQSDSEHVNSTSSNSSVGLVREPEELAAAIFTGLIVSGGMVSSEMESSRHSISGDTLYLTPVVVVKQSIVRVKIDGVGNHSSSLATLHGMAEGYNFSTQQSHPADVSHILESWSVTYYDDGSQGGELQSIFTCFGITQWDTSTRTLDDWSGSIDLEMTLSDSSTVSHSTSIEDKTSIDDNSDSLTTSIYIDIGFSDDEESITLPDVNSPSSGDAGGFDASVEDWTQSERVDIEL